MFDVVFCSCALLRLVVCGSLRVACCSVIVVCLNGARRLSSSRVCSMVCCGLVVVRCALLVYVCLLCVCPLAFDVCVLFVVCCVLCVVVG